MFETECGTILRAGDQHAVSTKQKITKYNLLSPIVIEVSFPVLHRVCDLQMELRESQFMCLLSVRDMVRIITRGG